MSNTITYPITLDLRRNLYQIIVMKENDANSRIIQAKITDNGQLYNITSDSSSDNYIAVKWHKPDGHVIHNIAYTAIDNNTIEVVCTDQMLCVAGVAEAEFVFYRSNDIISTMKFNVSIDSSVVSNIMIESSDEFGLLNELVTKNKALRDELEELEENVSNAEDARVVAENERKDAESKRNDAEVVRKTNEIKREDAEATRNTNEEQRINNEIIREGNETVREKGYSEMQTAISDMQDTIDEFGDTLSSFYTTDEIDNKFSALESNIVWKESVETYNNIATTYPNPIDGWTVNVKDTDYTYRYDGEDWIAISANAIPKATNNVDGLFTKENFQKLEGITENASSTSISSLLEEGTQVGILNIDGVDYSILVPEANTIEIITESINDEPVNQKEGGYWIFEY